jgi:glutamate dehydrogenase
VRLAAETGETAPEIVETFLAVQSIFGLTALWAELARLDGVVPGPLQLDLYAGLQDLTIEEAVRLSRRRHARSFADMIAHYQPAVAEIVASLPGILPPAERARLEAEAARLEAAGVPGGLAQRLAGIGLLRRALPLVELAGENGAGVAETARVVFAAADVLSLEEVKRRAGAMQVADDFDRQAIARALAVIDGANSAICDRMLHDPAARGAPLDQWARTHAPQLLVARPLIERVLADDGLTLARLDAIADSLRELT